MSSAISATRACSTGPAFPIGWFDRYLTRLEGKGYCREYLSKHEVTNGDSLAGEVFAREYINISAENLEKMKASSAHIFITTLTSPAACLYRKYNMAPLVIMKAKKFAPMNEDSLLRETTDCFIVLVFAPPEISIPEIYSFFQGKDGKAYRDAYAFLADKDAAKTELNAFFFGEKGMFRRYLASHYFGIKNQHSPASAAS